MLGTILTSSPLCAQVSLPSLFSSPFLNNIFILWKSHIFIQCMSIRSIYYYFHPNAPNASHLATVPNSCLLLLVHSLVFLLLITLTQSPTSAAHMHMAVWPSTRAQESYQSPLFQSRVNSPPTASHQLPIALPIAVNLDQWVRFSYAAKKVRTPMK